MIEFIQIVRLLSAGTNFSLSAVMLTTLEREEFCYSLIRIRPKRGKYHHGFTMSAKLFLFYFILSIMVEYNHRVIGSDLLDLIS